MREQITHLVVEVVAPLVLIRRGVLPLEPPHHSHHFLVIHFVADTHVVQATNELGVAQISYVIFIVISCECVAKIQMTANNLIHKQTHINGTG